jgi:Uncharacterized protein conserved in bacteria
VASNTQDNVNLAQGAPTIAVGQSLKAAREVTGRAISDVALHLRIRQPFLEALEDGRHRDLPGGTYAVGFLRTYAEFLGLDGEEMVRRFRAEAAGELNARSELVFPSPVSEGRIPGGAVLFLGVVLAGLAYGGWYLLSSGDSQVAEIVPPLPERLASVLNRPATLTGEAPKPAEPASTPEEAPGAEDGPPAVDAAQGQAKVSDMVPPVEDEDDARAPEPAPSAPAAPVPTPATAVPEAASPAAPPAQESAPAAIPAPAATAAEPVPEGKVIGEEHTDSRVLLKAVSDDCWVQVRELDGQLLLSRLLRRGDSYRVPNRAGLTLMVGNAGALEITVDGRKTPPLGNAGQVRRDIRLDPDKLLPGG